MEIKSVIIKVKEKIRDEAGSRRHVSYRDAVFLIFCPLGRNDFLQSGDKICTRSMIWFFTDGTAHVKLWI